MAKAFGARVITTVLSDEVAKAIEHLYADLIINTGKESLVDVMKAELEAGRGVDIAIDCLGGEAVGQCLPYMNRRGSNLLHWVVNVFGMRKILEAQRCKTDAICALPAGCVC